MRIPNLNALRTFDAAARHLNFRRASEELLVTQGAVAQQVRRLESDIGQILFIRRARGLQLTAAGQTLHPQIRRAIALIEQAFEQLSPAEKTVVLSVPPSFAAKWLVPKLPGFDRDHPNITLRISAEESVTDFRTSDTDIAIRQGRRPSESGIGCALLSPLDLVAVAREDVADAIGPIDSVKPFADAVLIQDGHLHWDRLLRKAGLGPRGRVIQFNQTSLAMDAALNGQGVALIPELFLAPDHKLAVLWRDENLQDVGFHILWPETNAKALARQTVVEWLLTEGNGGRGQGRPKKDCGSISTGRG